MSELYDLLTLGVWSAAGLVLGWGWLFVQSSGGTLDIDAGDAQVAAAIALAMPPTWLAWFGRGVLSGRTWGQSRTGLFVEGNRRGRALRFAAHPLAGPLWTWLTLLMLAAGQPLLAIATAIMLGAVVLGGMVSFLGWVFRPEARSVHDRIAGTRVSMSGAPS